MDVVSSADAAALGDVRVLDLTDELGAYCAKLLADLGADVIRIEPLCGAALRRHGPFHRDEPDLERGLGWFYLNTNKRGITLDLDSHDGQAILKRLATNATALLEDTTPGTMERRGLGYADLSRLNPSLIYTSITPYGQTGPYAEYLASDLTAQAMGGVMCRVGWPDEPPNSMAGGQAYNQVGTQAAAATLAALYSRDSGGTGQHVDISMHESVAVIDFDALPRYAFGGEMIARGAAPGQVGRPGTFGFHAKRIWRCNEGKVRFVLISMVAPAKEWGYLVSWLNSHGMAADLTEPIWQDMDYRVAHLPHIEELIAAFLATISARQAMEEAQERGIYVMAFGHIHELFDDPQLVDTGFFVAVEHPALQERVTYPGGPYRLSETPWQIRRPAPQLGEHNSAVYEGELGLSREEIVRLTQAGVI